MVWAIFDTVVDLQTDHILAGVQSGWEKGLASFWNFLVSQTEEAGAADVGRVAFCIDSGVAAGIVCFQDDKQVQGKFEELPGAGSSFSLHFDLEPALMGRKTELAMVLDKAHSVV